MGKIKLTEEEKKVAMLAYWRVEGTETGIYAAVEAVLAHREGAEKGQPQPDAQMVSVAERDAQWEKAIQEWAEESDTTFKLSQAPFAVSSHIRARLAPKQEPSEKVTGPNVQTSAYRIGLDKVTAQRNRIVAMDIPDPNCSDVRDAFVLALDILVQVLSEHFPLMTETHGEDAPKQESRTVEGILTAALEKLAKLGNGNMCGNSDGNVIAQQALKDAAGLRAEIGEQK